MVAEAVVEVSTSPAAAAGDPAPRLSPWQRSMKPAVLQPLWGSMLLSVMLQPLWLSKVAVVKLTLQTVAVPTPAAAEAVVHAPRTSLQRRSKEPPVLQWQ